MKYLDTATALSIYKAMILPYFDYCDVIYQGAGKEILEKLQRLQNKCLKTCLGLCKRHDTQEVHRLAKCAKLNDRRKTHVCNFMYLRQRRGELMDDRDISTRLHDAPVFKVKIPVKESFKRSVQYAGSTIWNSLPTDLRNLDCYPAFKLRQKMLLRV